MVKYSFFSLKNKYFGVFVLNGLNIIVYEEFEFKNR